MIFMNHGSFVQTKQGFQAAYEMYLEDRKYASARILNDVFHAQLHFDSNSGCSYILKPISISSLKKRGITAYGAGRSPYEIYLSTGELCGFIYQKKHSGFLSGYQYTQLQFMGKQYAVYVVDIWGEGAKFPIYRTEGQEHQVALIEKPEVVYNRLDQYSWMTLYEEDIDVVGLYLLYFDYMANNHNRMEVVKSSKEVHKAKTLNKALLAKYDENFKQL